MYNICLVLTAVFLYRMAHEVAPYSYMVDYYPYYDGHGQYNLDSETIRYLKGNGVYDAVRRNEFLGRVREWLRESINAIRQNHPETQIVIGIAPGHAPGNHGFMEHQLNIEALDVTFNPALLQRHTPIPRQADNNAPRNIQTHLDSINVIGDVVGRVVCILDDVWTTGSTLSACRQLVEARDPVEVYLLAIGRTV